MSPEQRAGVVGVIDGLLREFSGRGGVAAKNLLTGEHLNFNEDQVFPTASTAKVWVLVEVFRQAEAGTLNLETRVPVRQHDVIHGSGILRDLQPGVELTVRDLATLMMTLSDNTATNMCIDFVHIDSIRQMMSELGLSNSRLNNKIDFDLIVSDAGSFGEGSTADFVKLIELIANHGILTEESCEAVIGIMGRSQHLDFAPRWLPYNPLARELGFDQEIVVANKTGAVTGIRSDVLLVRHPRAEYVAAFMTDGCRDERWCADNEANLLIARISRLIFDYFTA